MVDPWIERLSEYREGELTEEERASLEEHVTGCARCTRRLETLAGLDAAVEALETPVPGADMWPAVADRIGSRRAGRRRFLRAAGMIAAAFFLGVLVGIGVAPAPAEDADGDPAGDAAEQAALDSSSRFLLVLYRTASLDEEPRAREREIAASVNRHREWARKMYERGVVELGEKLDDHGFRLDPDVGEPRDSDDRMAGMFLIRAADYERAFAVASSCPHYLEGGPISVRRIDDGRRLPYPPAAAEEPDGHRER